MRALRKNLPQVTKFDVRTLRKDTNYIAIQDPSAVWGIQDFLPRRNLLGYTEALSQYVDTTDTTGKWTRLCSGTGSYPTITDAYGTAPDSTQTATRIQLNQGANTTSSDFSIFRQINLPAVVGVSYIQKVWMKSTDGSSTYSIHFNNGNVAAGGVVSVTGTWTQFSYTITADVTNRGIEVMVRGTYGTSTTADILVWHPQVMRADTIDQSYQKITDFVTEQYAWAAQKQVLWLRRNILSNTDNLLGSNWSATAVTASADKFLETTANSNHRIGDSGGFPFGSVGKNVYLSCKVKGISRQYIGFSNSGLSATDWVVANLSGLSTTKGSGVVSSAITGPDIDEYYTVTATFLVTANGALRIQSLSTGTIDEAFIGDAAKGFYLKNLMLSYSQSEYQPILASWDATYTANAIAAGYPISLWHDSAGTIAAWESGRAIGAVRDQKYEGYMPNLVSNGTFDSDTSGWSNNDAGVTLSVESGKLKVVTGAMANRGAIQDIATTAGKTYYFSALMRTASASISVRVIKNPGGTFAAQTADTTSTTEIFGANYFTAEAGSTYQIYCRISLSSSTAYFDNVSVREIPGYTAIQSTAANQPLWYLDANGKGYFSRDLTNDSLPITLPTVLSDSQLGPELVTNGADREFSSDTGTWNKGTDWVISSGVASKITGSGLSNLQISGLLTVGKAYKVELDVVSSTGTPLVYVGVGSSSYYSISGAGHKSFIKVCEGTTAFVIQCSASGTLVVDNISVREVTGTNVVYTAEGNVTLKNSGLVLSGSYAPITPAVDYGRIIMAGESKYDAKILKYLDQKRGRGPYVLGPELVTNGGFDSDTWWSKGINWTITGGVAVATSTPTDWGVSRASLLTQGKTYAITYTVTSITGGAFRPLCGTNYGTSRNSAGTYTDIVSSGTDTTFYLLAHGTTSGTIDNISVREVILT